MATFFIRLPEDPESRISLIKMFQLIEKETGLISFIPALKIDAPPFLWEFLTEIGAERIPVSAELKPVDDTPAMPSEKKRGRGRPPSSNTKAQAPKYCLECGRMVKVLTKTGICKPCAMKNAREKKKQASDENVEQGQNGRHDPDDPKVIFEPDRDAAQFLTRHGAIKARKLA